MVSQAAQQAGDSASQEYKDAWAGTRQLTVQKGFSWSGHEHNHTFLNLGGAKFADVSRLSNCDCEGDGRSAAIIDWDDDGKLDIVLKNRTGPRLQIFHNRYRNGGNFLAFELSGNGVTCNRDAIGARVTVELEDRVVGRTLRAGEGFLAQSSKRLHFGVGSSSQAKSVTVAWPDGTSSYFENVKANGRYHIAQSSEGESMRVLEARTADLASVPHLELKPLGGKAKRVVLAYELPMGPVPIPSYTDPARTVADLAGQPVLLNVWQVECAGCRVELHEFEQEAERLRATGVRVVPINAEIERNDDQARATLEKHGISTADAGYQDDALHAVLFESIYKHVFAPRSNVNAPMPTSFLLDAESNLVVIYNGPVTVDQLEADLRALENKDDRPALDRLSHGFRMIHHKRNFGQLAELLDEVGARELAQYYRRIDQELHSYFIRHGERREIR